MQACPFAVPSLQTPADPHWELAVHALLLSFEHTLQSLLFAQLMDESVLHRKHCASELQVWALAFEQRPAHPAFRVQTAAALPMGQVPAGTEHPFESMTHAFVASCRAPLLSTQRLAAEHLFPMSAPAPS